MSRQVSRMSNGALPFSRQNTTVPVHPTDDVSLQSKTLAVTVIVSTQCHVISSSMRSHSTVSHLF